VARRGSHRRHKRGEVAATSSARPDEGGGASYHPKSGGLPIVRHCLISLDAPTRSRCGRDIGRAEALKTATRCTTPPSVLAVPDGPAILATSRKLVTRNLRVAGHLPNGRVGPDVPERPLRRRRGNRERRPGLRFEGDRLAHGFQLVPARFSKAGVLHRNSSG
jgi:hypothetical protein